MTIGLIINGHHTKLLYIIMYHAILLTMCFQTAKQHGQLCKWKNMVGKGGERKRVKIGEKFRSPHEDWQGPKLNGEVEMDVGNP